jgi:type I restriction enzyme S subunit
MSKEGAWKILKLSEVATTTSGGTPSRSNQNFYSRNIPWVKSGELNYNVITDTEEHISEEALKRSSAKIVPAGTLLIALYGATVGRLAFLDVDAATNQAVCAITPKSTLNKKYLYFFLLSKQSYLLENRIGGAQPNISQSILRNVAIPIPELEKQLQIVLRIEELLSELDSFKSQIEDLGFELSKNKGGRYQSLRQSILAKAFKGEL